MDVLDPAEIIPAAGVVSNGMKTDEVIRVINDISDNFDVIGLTIAEPMPRIAIKLKNMLENCRYYKLSKNKFFTFFVAFNLFLFNFLFYYCYNFFIFLQ